MYTNKTRSVEVRNIREISVKSLCNYVKITDMIMQKDSIFHMPP